MAKNNANQQAGKSEPTDKLIPMDKDGQTINVCAAQVEPHQRLGWKIKEEKEKQ